MTELEETENVRWNRERLIIIIIIEKCPHYVPINSYIIFK